MIVHTFILASNASLKRKIAQKEFFLDDKDLSLSVEMARLIYILG